MAESALDSVVDPRDSRYANDDILHQVGCLDLLLSVDRIYHSREAELPFVFEQLAFLALQLLPVLKDRLRE